MIRAARRGNRSGPPAAMLLPGRAHHIRRTMTASLRMRLIAPLFSLMLPLVASPLAAQRADAVRLDVALGPSRVQGGLVDYRKGAMADALIAGGLRSTSVGS